MIVGDNNDESNKYIGGKPEFIPDTKNGTGDPPYVHKRLKKFIDLLKYTEKRVETMKEDMSILQSF